MRLWNFWINRLILYSQDNPPRFIELVMLTLAIALLIISTILPDAPYLILGLSFVIGASISILIRESITTNHSISHYNQPISIYQHLTKIIALILLGVSIYAFIDLTGILRK